MPKEIPETVTRRIIRQWIKGLSPKEIADKYGVAESSVRNKIAEARSGNYPEYVDYAEELDDMRWVARQLRGKGQSLQEVTVALAILKGLTELQIDPVELYDALKLFQKLKRGDILPEKFLESSRRLMELEETTGIRYEKLIENHHKITEHFQELKEEETRCKASIAKLRYTEEQFLRGSSVTKGDLDAYKKDRLALGSVSLSFKDLNCAAEFIRGTKDRSLLDAAAELARLKPRTGKSYEHLIDEYGQKSIDLDRLKTQAQELEQKQQTLREQCTKAETRLEAELRQAKVAREQLARHVETRQQLASCGLQLEEIENLPMVVGNLKAAGYDYRKIIAYLGQVRSIQTKTEEAKDTLKTLQSQIDNQKLELGRIQQQTATAKQQLQQLDESTEAKLYTLKELQHKKEGVEAIILFADGFTKLMLDPLRLIDFQIETLISTLGAIKATRAHPMRLPVDYEGLRLETQTLLEAVLGKQLIPRETYMREVQSLRDINLELQRDRLGKLADIGKERRDLETARKAFETMTRRQLVTTAVTEVAKGSIIMQQCQRCNSVLAHKEKYWSSFCPFCSIGHLETVTLRNH